MTKKKDENRYIIAINLPPVKVERMKGLLSFLDMPIHTFISEAIENEIDYRLQKMSDSERAITETIIENRIKKMPQAAAVAAAMDSGTQ